MCKIQDDEAFELHVFVTGMHMLSKYGYTCEEVQKAGFKNIYRFINQNINDGMDHILSKTISGFADFIREIKPDMVMVHGDRLEALAGATVGALNNILVGHIEGGEVSGTIDELIRHSVSKLSHIHFVSNNEAKTRLIQLGESLDNIHVIGSPDVDVMNSGKLPTLDEVKLYYEFDFCEYGVLLFHPVTTELHDIGEQVKVVVDEVINSGFNYIVVYPNNDMGTEVILNEYARFKDLSRIRTFPSMRFEFFLTTLKNSKFIIGNSSAGVREAPHFGVPAISLGTRQNRRVECDTILNVAIEAVSIRSAISEVSRIERTYYQLFGNGGSDEKFYEILKNPAFWEVPVQKVFVDQKTE